MGRGVFTNLIVESTDNPYLVPTARGDDDFTSSLPYLEDSDETGRQISDTLTNMYRSLHRGEHKEEPQTIVDSTAEQIDSTDEQAVEIKPDDYTLGISFGTIAEYDVAAAMAAHFNTHTLMVYCDNNRFSITGQMLRTGQRLVLHGPLAVNLAAENDDKRRLSVNRIGRIIDRCNMFSNYIDALVLHPGSAESVENLLQSLDALLPYTKFDIAIENMSGKGKQLMSRLDDLRVLLDTLSQYPHLKVCIDTCHLNDAGYDLTDYGSLSQAILDTFNIDEIAVFHVNDSRHIRGSHKDNHANIGAGTIPVDTLAKLVQDERFKGIPKVLETPQTERGYIFGEEMRLLLQKQ